MKKEIILRKDVDLSRIWDLSSIYQNEEEFSKDVLKLEGLVLRMLESYKGKLTDSININLCLDDLKMVSELSGRLGSYRFLAVSADMTNNENQSKSMEISNVLSKANSKLSFIESEILENDEIVIKAAMDENEENRHFLSELLREKPHSLSSEGEKALATLSGVLYSPMTLYNKA